jgi:LuxR family maltose regulon positive regulatory protein
VAEAAVRAGIATTTIGRVLRRQAPEGITELLQGLLGDTSAPVRARAATLIGDLGAAAAYPALRALTKDRSGDVRQAAERALGRLIYRPPYRLHVRTLGSFGIWRGDQEVRDRDWRSSKARQLFQLLLTERGRALPRDQVIEILWPDMEPEPAANNLRVTINRLSKAIEPERPEGAPPAYLLQQSETYSLNLESDIAIDAVQFAAAAEEGRQTYQRGQRPAAVAALRRAVELYGGPYLPDCLYEDWSTVERERLALLFNETALLLATLLLEEGKNHDAIGLAWRVLDYDRAYEEAYRVLMRAHAALGERSTALRLYDRCVAVLQEELGVGPLPETTALYNQLKA